MSMINRYLDVAFLKPELSEGEVRVEFEKILGYDVRSFCVRPCDIELASRYCQGIQTVVGCVLNFPHGAATPQVKKAEAECYLQLGVSEIDMVVNYGCIRSGYWEKVEEDIAAVHAVTSLSGVLLKVILETAVLTVDEIRQATRVAAVVGADYVKTSTGFNGEGATVEAVTAMLQASDGKIKVKASGGIRDYDRAQMFLEIGCQRLGVNYPSVPKICSQQSSGEGRSSGY
ncbi:MAG: deoxyribose-phosphate aldolase [Anaerolineales bacterium]|nr:deoxyribose-phosphate aldolase [Anaerolineales bacterium]